jgi:hypothetical protein
MILGEVGGTREGVKRVVGSLWLGSIATVFVVVAACSDSTESACKVDTDCPQGTICREERCGATSPDSGLASLPDAAPSTCVSDGLSCNGPDECCSRACTSGRCGAAPPPAPTCKNLYELCQSDCCQGLTCTSGACR